MSTSVSRANGEPYNIFTSNSSQAKVTTAEGHLLVNIETGEVLHISRSARRILGVQTQIGSDEKAPLKLSDLFLVSEEDYSRLATLRASHNAADTGNDGAVEFRLAPVRTNLECGPLEIYIKFIENCSTLSISIETQVFGSTEALAFARSEAPAVYFLWKGEVKNSFDTFTLVQTNSIESFGSDRFTATSEPLGLPALLLFRGSECHARIFSMHCKIKLGFSLSPSEQRLCKQYWCFCTDGSLFVSVDNDTLFYSVVSILPNNFVCQRLFLVYRDAANVLDSVPMGVVLWDWASPPGDAPEGANLNDIPVVLRFGNECAKPFFCGVSDPIGKPMSMLLPYMVGNQIHAAFTKALRTGKVVQLGESMPHVGKSLGAITDSVYNVRAQPVTKTSVVVTWRDCTTAVRARVLSDRLHILLDHAPVLCILATRSLHVVYMNSFGRAMARVPADPDFNISTVTLVDLLPGLVQAGGEEGINFPSDQTPTSLCAVDGTKISVIASVTRLLGPIQSGADQDTTPPDKIVYIAVFARENDDESEDHCRLRLDVKRAEAAASAKSDFLATMSHEIRTPLHGIVGCSELLQGSSKDPWQQQLIHSIHNCSASLLGIINDILDFAKIESRKLELEHEPLIFSDVLDSCIAVVAAEMRRKKQTFIYSICESSPPKIIGDASRIRQIVLNLLSNAIKFTPENGTVQLGVCVCAQKGSTPCPRSATFDDCWCPELACGTFRRVFGGAIPQRSHMFRFFVKDNGRGMSKIQVGAIFEPFVQARAVGSSKGLGLHSSESGTGLGLCIVRKLIELFGGGISVRAAEARGCCFSVWLPVDIPPPSPPTADFLYPPDVALVSDYAGERQALASLLKHSGLAPVVFESISAVLEANTETLKSFDVIFLNVNVDDIQDSNLQCLKACLAPSETSQICFVASISSQMLIRQYLDADRKYVALFKPISVGSLRSIVETASQPPPNVTKHASSECEEEKIKILIVEDNPTNRFVLRQMLSNVGVSDNSIVEVEDGIACLEALRKEPFDIILMDIHMPRMSGWEAARHIRQNPAEYQKCGTIVALTAASTLAEREESLKYMDMFIPKPLQMSKLTQVLTQCCQNLHIRRHFRRRSGGSRAKLATSPPPKQAPISIKGSSSDIFLKVLVVAFIVTIGLCLFRRMNLELANALN